MGDHRHQFEIFSTRSGCNMMRRYFDAVLDIIHDFEKEENLANILHHYLGENLIKQNEIQAVISILLADKYKYHYSSCNLENDITRFDSMIEEFKKWNAVDMVFIYYHPELGVFPFNPKVKAHWSRLELLRKHELMTMYTGRFMDTDDDETFDMALESAVKLLKGKKIKTPDALVNGKYGEEEEEEAAEAAMKYLVEESPFYSIPVSNNQFHNGNVEAWKRIINSYSYYFKDIRVIIYYEGEEIKDIDSLFKWGKIKLGTCISVKLVGEDLRNKNMSTLISHLKQGASPFFENYLKGNPRMILNIFGKQPGR